MGIDKVDKMNDQDMVTLYNALIVDEEVKLAMQVNNGLTKMETLYKLEAKMKRKNKGDY